ncbi:hypothetical protein MIND_00850000 [Mycena indigotica]|uniref:Uncharacterized protein n=1 Tax=Mycena indigotica TaxID=2126181 RepID=A0A8H6SHL1_9AGAR|nr:uncharacterized protein MIND_00850000 [Mycena indigotica]KAF7299017.1 hypothetical protein MIND_00850000 [Mycena indigotica]
MWARARCSIARMTASSSAISTLDPAKLRARDFLDLSSLRRFLVAKGSKTECRSMLYYQQSQKNIVPFPPKTTGFLYYYRPPNGTSVAGALRFRCVKPQQDPQDHFATGTDLILEDGHTPWELPPARFARTQLPALRRLLLEDGLVTLAELAHCRETMALRFRTRLHSFSQPFVTEFGVKHHLHIFFANGDSELLCLRGPFVDQIKQKLTWPYQGKALVRFELSAHPSHIEDGKKYVVIRIIKMISPPMLRISNYLGYLPPPVEGELVMRRRRKSPLGKEMVKKDLIPWAVNLNSSTDVGRILARLFSESGELST